MRKIYSFLLLTLVSSLIFVGCNKDNVDEALSAEVSVKLSPDVVEGFEATSATFDIKATNVESFACKVHKGEFSGSTSGAVIYADAEQVVEMEGEQMSHTVYGLDGDEQYTIEFAFKVKGASKYVVKSATVDTDDYNARYIHMISAEQTSLKFVINMPEGVKYRYSLVDRSKYEMGRYDYAWDDMTFLRYGVTADGRKEVVVNDGDIVGQDADGEYQYQLVKPGMSFVLMVVECDNNYNPIYEQVDFAQPSEAQRASQKPNVGDYTEECSDNNIKVNGIYAKQYFTTAQPDEAEGSVAVDIVTTERTAKLSFTPSDEVVRYGYSVWTDQELSFVRGILGEDGLITALQDDFIPQTEASEAEFGIELGVDYNIVMIHISDEQELTRTTTIIPFKATASTSAPVEIIVTPEEYAVNEDGSINPYCCAFNIKAPNKDCKRIALAYDYTRSFIPEVNGMEGTREQNIENIVLSYGMYISEADDMGLFDDINSDEGLYVDFYSFEDTEGMLAVVSFNEDEKTYLSYCTSRSAAEPAKEHLTTDEFEMLDGEWTATYRYNADWDEPTAPVRENKFKMTITSDPGFDAPETFDASDPKYAAIYDFYVGRGTQLGMADPASYATTQIQTDFADFKELAAKYKAKYESQNRKIMYGFVLDSDMGVENHTPWGLFCDLNYSSYDVEQLFYDFGPKIFLEVLKDESGEKVIRMVNDEAVVAPFYSYYGSENRVAGLSLGAWADFGYESQTGIFVSNQGMPLVVKDNDNISLESIVDEYGNDDYYLSITYDMMGADLVLAVGKDNLNLTRGYNEVQAVAPSKSAPASYKSKMQKPAWSAWRTGHTFKRMYMPHTR